MGAVRVMTGGGVGVGLVLVGGGFVVPGESVVIGLGGRVLGGFVVGGVGLGRGPRFGGGGLNTGPMFGPL